MKEKESEVKWIIENVKIKILKKKVHKMKILVTHLDNKTIVNMEFS